MLDLVKLRLQTLNVCLSIPEDRFKQFTASIVADLCGRSSAFIVRLPNLMDGNKRKSKQAHSGTSVHS